MVSVFNMEIQLYIHAHNIVLANESLAPVQRISHSQRFIEQLNRYIMNAPVAMYLGIIYHITAPI